MTDFKQILSEMRSVYEERNSEYNNNYKESGPLYAALFPNGVFLRTESDFMSFSLFMLVLMKITRIAQGWDKVKKDSIIDAANYLVMLAEVRDADTPNS